MEQYQLSKRQSSAILLLSLAIHFAIIIILLHHHPSDWQQKLIPLPLNNQDEYVVQQILSTGQSPATVLFQEEAPEEPQTVAAEDDISEALEPSEAMQENRQQEQSSESTTITTDSAPEPSPTPTKPKRRKKKVAKRESVTLAQISQGFIKSAQQEAGYNNAARDSKQLALQIYASKVWNCLKNSFLVGESCLHLPQSVSAQTQLSVIINREGKLIDIKLIYPEQITELQHVERLLVGRAKQSGLFPPFSTQMQGETQRFSFPLYIKGEQGFHTYALSCR